MAKETKVKKVKKETKVEPKYTFTIKVNGDTRKSFLDEVDDLKKDFVDKLSKGVKTNVYVELELGEKSRHMTLTIAQVKRIIRTNLALDLFFNKLTKI